MTGHTEYAIIQTDNRKGFCAVLEERESNGWEMVGNLSVTYDQEAKNLLYTMLMEKEKEDQ